jgi:hypothetical protein
MRINSYDESVIRIFGRDFLYALVKLTIYTVITKNIAEQILITTYAEFVAVVFGRGDT